MYAACYVHTLLLSIFFCPQIKHINMGVGAKDSCLNAAIDDNVCTNDEFAIVDDIFNLLDDNEKERAARASSYRYLMTSRPATDERDQHVRALIKRYVIVEQKLSTTPDKMEEIAYNKLKNTLQYREEKQVDDILRCFDKSKSPNSDRFTTLLEDRFATGASYIRGFTKDGKAIFISECYMYIFMMFLVWYAIFILT